MISSNAVNKPEVLAELELLFGSYEKALKENDVKALQAFFWPSPHALRFGATEQLYGSKEIDEFRQNRVINFTSRTTLRQDIVSLGDDIGIATLEFTAIFNGVKKHGRQSQVWIRFGELGWRIVSAHVSHKVEKTSDADAVMNYLKAASAYTGLPVSDAHAGEVALNLQVMSKVAGPLMDFQLDDDLEPAPRFFP